MYFNFDSYFLYIDSQIKFYRYLDLESNKSNFHSLRVYSKSKPKMEVVYEDSSIPRLKRGSEDSAGLDISCIGAFSLEPKERTTVSTGVKIKTGKGTYTRIAPRSGLAIKHGLHTLAGVIDCDYTGEVKVALINLGDEIVHIKARSRIAQLIVTPFIHVDITEVETLGVTDRGSNGFGSSG